MRKEWQAVKAGINHEGMYIDAVVNGIHLVQLLADTGCLTNAIVSVQFARKAGMTLLDVEPRRLHQVIFFFFLNQYSYSVLDYEEGHWSGR